MSYRYEQSTGRFSIGGKLLATGYSGLDAAKNDPDRQHEPRVGPIPRGIYRIGRATDTLTHGPIVLPLSPVPGTETHGRSGFLIHGDSKSDPGRASLGCIILPPHVRALIDTRDEKWLEVVR